MNPVAGPPAGGSIPVRVLGVDPGLGCTGYAVLEGPPGTVRPALVEAGALRTDGKTPLERRLTSLHGEIAAVLQEFQPEVVALEELYSEYRFPRTALLMAHARGAIVLAAGQAGVPVRGFTAPQVKMAVVGHGAASKEQVQATVARLLGLAAPPQPNDVADAIALAVTALRRAGSPGASSGRRQALA